jgi:putative ABC transport system permease protein
MDIPYAGGSRLSSTLADLSMDTLLQDVRYAARKLLRTPGFTIVAVLTLALGIGATTAMWAIVDGILIRPLPYPDPGRVVRIASLGREKKPNAMSAPDFIDYRNQSTSFVGMAGTDVGNVNLTRPGSEPTRIRIGDVGAPFFDLLGIQPQRGRYFRPGEDDKGAAKVVVLSDVLWRSRFGADPSIVGKPISLNGANYEVVGIAPPRFDFPDRVEAWRPFVFADWMIDPSNRGAHFMYAIGRVKPGVSVATAGSDLSTVARRLAEKFPDSNKGFGASVQPLQEYLVGPVGPALQAMLGAVLFVLLIACANVANLLLVRAASRETEMAVRTALGAGRTRIARQLITESALLAVAGAAFGVGLAAWLLLGVQKLGAAQVPLLENVTIDARILGFAILAGLVTGCLFGLAPALHAMRTSVGQMLRSGARGIGGRTANRTRNTLVVVELALATVLLVGAGLLTKSFARLLSVNPGFTPDHVVSFKVSLPAGRYPQETDARKFVARALADLREIPGTQSASASFFKPFDNGMMRTSFEIRGEAPRKDDQRALSMVEPVSPDYFRTLGMRVKAGRIFDESENGFSGEPVVVINEALARKYFPNTNPIGQYFTFGIGHDTAAVGKEVTVQGKVIGVVGDVKQRDLKSDVLPTTFIPYNTYAVSELTFLIRTTSPLAGIAPLIRSRLRQIDADLPLFKLETMEEAMSGTALQQRFFMTLLAGFATLAVILAALGIYGVISYSVAQRTREMGIRIALGASRQRVVKLVVSHGAMLAGTGLALGATGAYWMTRLIAGLLFNTPAKDPATFAVVAIILGSVAILAAYLPARRAASTDPVVTMRAE